MKRKIMALLVGVLIGVNSFSVFAQEQLSEEVKNAIVAAKSKINIDEDYSEFSYETIIEDGLTFYNMTWTDSDDNSIDITVDSEGRINYYKLFYNNKNDNKPLLNNIKKNEAQLIAEEFVKKTIPNRASQLEIINISDNYEEFVFEFAQKIDGIPVLCNDTEVNVSKATGEVINFHSLGEYWQDRINRKNDDLIDLETAKKAFIENDGIKLLYKTEFDYKTKSASVYPIYEVNPISINAHNAKVIDAKNDVYSNYSLAASKPEAAGDSGMEYEFTESELEAVKKSGNFINSKDAGNIIKKYNIVKNSFTLTEGVITESGYNKEEYFWNFDGTDDVNDFSFSVDASTGKLNSFYKYTNYNEENTSLISESIAKDKLNTYLKLLSPEVINSVSYSSDIYLSEYDNAYSLTYNRKINNTEVDSNYIYIKIDAVTGELVRFNKKWYNDIKISDKPINLSVEAAFDVFDKYSDFSLSYKLIAKENEEQEEKIDAVYSAKNDFDNYIDPENGNILSYKGEEIPKTKLETGYTDISGYKYEDEINILFESGFYLDKSEFKPNDGMTRKDFLQLFYSKTKKNYDKDKINEEIETVLSEIGIKNAEEELTKNDCAKIICNFLGYSNLTDRDEIFENTYNDVDLDMRAEANIFSSFGFLDNGDDNFNGEYVITNGEGAHVIYKLVSEYKNS